MFFKVSVEEDGEHRWGLATCTCDPAEAADVVVKAVADAIRTDYGELDLLSELVVDPGVAKRFDVRAILAAFRMGLPDPDREGRKPEHLTNYRSETTEVLARIALAQAFDIRFPASPQAGKPNPNQPVLGFDGWGLMSLRDGRTALVLVQVKGTDAADRPPAEATKLATECARVPNEISAIARALSILAVRLSGADQEAVLGMLDSIGRHEPLEIGVAPTIVRGVTDANLEDLYPLRGKPSPFAPAVARGIVVSVGADLAQLGREAMKRARAA